MKSPKKIAAYTLSEILVVLILTAIVAGLAFSVLRLVQNHITSIQDNFDKNTQLNKLRQSLWLDFNRYSNISYDDRENKLTLRSEIDSTFYVFHKNYIATKLDTFAVPIKNNYFFLDGQQTKKSRVDAVKIITSKKFQNQEIFVFKKNSATLYMNGL